MSLYDDFYPVAVELLEELGADATLSGSTAKPTAAEKRAGRAAAKSPESRPTRAVVAPVEILGVDGRRTQQTRATMLAEPRQGDKLTMGSQTWIVGAVTKIAPQGQDILYIAEVSA